MNYQKTEDEYSIIKVCLTIMVVIAHIIVFFSDYGGVVEMPFHGVLNYCYHYIYSFVMSMFIFISGAIYRKGIDKGKYQDNFKFINKKFVRLLVPYFLWGIGIVAPVFKLLGFTEKSYVSYVFHGIILGKDSRHLWFLWTLFFIFVLMKSLQVVLKKGIIAELVILLISTVLCYYSWDFTGMFGINSIAHYFVYFMFGYFFEGKKAFFHVFLEKRPWISIMLFLLIGILVKTTNNFNINFILPWIGIIMMYGLVVAFHKWIYTGKLYYYLKKNSFGIYLVHPMIIYVVFYLFGEKFKNYPLLFCMIVFPITLVLSYGITEMIRKLKGNVLLGEI